MIVGCEVTESDSDYMLAGSFAVRMLLDGRRQEVCVRC